MEKLEQLIEKGYQIAEADGVYDRESWHLPTWLRASLDAAHCALIDIDSGKDENCDESDLLTEKQHLLNQILEFITFTGDTKLEFHLNEYLKAEEDDIKADRKLKILYFEGVVREIEEYITERLPFWKYDERLLDYGFSPVYYNASYHISDKIDINQQVGLAVL
ncbi:MAG: hypothetical protein ACLFSQ_02660 [Candidatus Zixiibacteriota bacterium]